MKYSMNFCLVEDIAETIWTAPVSSVCVCVSFMCFEDTYLTRPGVDKVKPKEWFKYSLWIDY